MISTDLPTPLGAYLRLRGIGSASARSKSVERGRLGGARGWAWGPRPPSTRRKDLELVVGYLAYDHVARLEPTVPLPTPGPWVPGERLVVAETLVRFDHGAGTAERSPRGRPRGGRGQARGRHPLAPGAPGHSGPLRRFPDRERYEEMVRVVKDHIVAGDVFQCVPSQRAERPTSAAPLDVYRALLA